MDDLLRRPMAAPCADAVAQSAPQVTTPVVALDDVCWGPPRRPDILSGISFAVPPGQIMAICGANGAGKSSLLRLIYRHHAPRCGTVTLMGRDLWATSPQAAARDLAAVLQEQPADLALSTRQIVALGRLPHRRTWAAAFSTPEAAEKRIVDEAITRMDLTPLADRPFSTLSGGERQRAMVARALAQQPQVIVLDEPTNHLDIRHQLELLDLLRRLELTVICTLHDLTLAAEFAERVLVLDHGRILADGPPEHALTEAVLAQAFRVRARIDRSGPAARFAFHL